MSSTDSPATPTKSPQLARATSHTSESEVPLASSQNVIPSAAQQQQLQVLSHTPTQPPIVTSTLTQNEQQLHQLHLQLLKSHSPSQLVALFTQSCGSNIDFCLLLTSAYFDAANSSCTELYEINERGFCVRIALQPGRAFIAVMEYLPDIGNCVINKKKCFIKSLIELSYRHVIFVGYSMNGTHAFNLFVDLYLKRHSINDANFSFETATEYVEAISIGSPYSVDSATARYISSMNLHHRFTTVMTAEDVVPAIIPYMMANPLMAGFIANQIFQKKDYPDHDFYVKEAKKIANGELPAIGNFLILAKEPTVLHRLSFNVENPLELQSKLIELSIGTHGITPEGFACHDHDIYVSRMEKFNVRFAAVPDSSRKTLLPDVQLTITYAYSNEEFTLLTLRLIGKNLEFLDMTNGALVTFDNGLEIGFKVDLDLHNQISMKSLVRKFVPTSTSATVHLRSLWSNKDAERAIQIPLESSTALFLPPKCTPIYRLLARAFHIHGQIGNNGSPFNLAFCDFLDCFKLPREISSYNDVLTDMIIRRTMRECSMFFKVEKTLPSLGKTATTKVKQLTSLKTMPMGDPASNIVDSVYYVMEADLVGRSDAHKIWDCWGLDQRNNEFAPMEVDDEGVILSPRDVYQSYIGKEARLKTETYMSELYLNTLRNLLRLFGTDSQPFGDNESGMEDEIVRRIPNCEKRELEETKAELLRMVTCTTTGLLKVDTESFDESVFLGVADRLLSVYVVKKLRDAVEY